MKIDTIFYADDTADSDGSDAQGHREKRQANLLRYAGDKGRPLPVEIVSLEA